MWWIIGINYILFWEINSPHSLTIYQIDWTVSLAVITICFYSCLCSVHVLNCQVLLCGFYIIQVIIHAVIVLCCEFTTKVLLKCCLSALKEAFMLTQIRLLSGFQNFDVALKLLAFINFDRPTLKMVLILCMSSKDICEHVLYMCRYVPYIAYAWMH